jgi:dsDNA-specific endonuclease/ATPase MutS2
MTYPVTASDLASLRNELRELRRDYDAHIREIAAERSRREHAREMRLMVLFGILAVLDVIAFFIRPA